MPQRLILLSFLIIIPSLAIAQDTHVNGIMAGFTHLVFSIDHLVAILACGFLGYSLDRKKWYLLPLVFTSAMIMGGSLGIGNDANYIVEKIIAFSVFAIGFIITFRLRLAQLLIFVLLFVFGFFHGYAHGAEMPEPNNVFNYILGYTLSAVLFGVVGALIGKFVLDKRFNESYCRFVGGIVTGCGLMMLVG